MPNEPGDHTADRTPTASSLIRRVQSRDALAWQQLTELYGPLVYHWCRRLGLSDGDAPDVFQEVFAAVARRVSHFQVGHAAGSFRGWLWTITRNKVRDFFRHERNRIVAEGGTEAQLRLAQVPDPADEEPSDDPSDASESAALFHRALEMVRAEFEPRTWEAFWRTTVLQRTTDQVASELQMSAAAVRQAKSRVLRRLRATLG